MKNNKEKGKKNKACMMYNDEHDIEIKCKPDFEERWVKRGFRRICMKNVDSLFNY